MSKIITGALAVITATLTVITGLVGVDAIVLSGRVAPGITSGTTSLAGLNIQDLSQVYNAVEADFLSQKFNFVLDDHLVTHSLNELGVSLHQPSTLREAYSKSILARLSGQHLVNLEPIVDEQQLGSNLGRDFTDFINEPVNATLTFNSAGTIQLSPSVSGQRIDTAKLASQLANSIRRRQWGATFAVTPVAAAAEVLDREVASAQVLADQLLKQGLQLTSDDHDYTVSPAALQDMLVFAPQVDPSDNSNLILGVKLDPSALTEYLTTNLAPEVNQPPQNARFERDGDRVTQFAVPQDGHLVDVARTASHITAHLARFEATAPLAIDVIHPEVADISDIERLGITQLLATGTSDYAGSPNNRQHNISVGTDRYHGLLIPPTAEFSFNEFLGPVTAAAGFKPELVIKSNVTTPEYGGGLCQVSTTAFRAALNAGLEITQRRNHSYPVRYYGTPGLDATIYPPYTDLRFVNDTPGYILIQAHIEGTKLTFEFWGTDDGRQVAVAKPQIYDRQPNGALKALVTRQVTKNGQLVIDETYYSRYKSPQLFPKVLAANGELDEPSNPETKPIETTTPPPS